MIYVNIKGTRVPFVLSYTKGTSNVYAVHGLINYDKSKKETRTLEDIVKTYPDELLDLYNNMSKKAVNRSYEEYIDICTKYLMKYEKQLEVESKKIIHSRFGIDYLGFAYDNYTISFNNCMQYLEEDIIRLTVYHELCHLYTLKYNNSFSHNEDFYNILYQEFTPEEVKRINAS